VSQPFGRQANDQVVYSGQPPAALTTIFGSKLESRSRGTLISTGPASVSTVFAVAVAEIAAITARGIVIAVTGVVIQSALGHQLGQPASSPPSPVNRSPPGPAR
jgi:hypothetical protein